MGLATGRRRVQIAAEGLQDVLPGTNGLGAADSDGLMTAQGTDAIRNEAVCAPVAAADDVASPGRCGANE